MFYKKVKTKFVFLFLIFILNNIFQSDTNSSSLRENILKKICYKKCFNNNIE